MDVLLGKTNVGDVTGDLAKKVSKEVAKQVASDVGEQFSEKRQEAGEQLGAAGQHLRTGLGERVRDWRSDFRAKADQRLEKLMEQKDLTPETKEALAQRRQARLEETRTYRAKKQLLSYAQTPQETSVLKRVVKVTPWAGGTHELLRYTQLLDALAENTAESEMSVHRAIWALAERHVLSVSSHGIVSACVLAVDEFVTDDL